MTDEDWLRAGLADAVPDPPGAPDRAASALARARRARRRTTIVGAAGVVVTLAVVGAIATLGDGRSPDRAAAEPPSPFDVAGCPAAPVGAKSEPTDPEAPDAVPDGARSVRFCEGSGLPVGIPEDALVVGVDELTAAINALPVMQPPDVCPLVLGQGYRLVFGYDDGSTFEVSGGLGGCREAHVGSSVRTDSRAPWDRFFELLGEQRARLEPPPVADVSTIECSKAALDNPGNPLGGPQDMAVAVLCLTDGGQVEGRTEIPSEDLTTLLRDVATNSVANAGYLDCGATPPFPRLEGVTAWGERVTLRSECGNGWFTIDPSTNTVWQPGPEAAAIIERLVAAAD